jgi:transcriptional regulator GlxA family with amidase domain
MKTLLYKLIILLGLLATAQYVSAQNKTAYYCPPCGGDCDTIAFTAPGKCPHCGMELVKGSVEEHNKIAAQKRYKILFYLQDGIEVLDFAGPMEVFSYAGFDVVTVSKTREPIKAQGILTVMPDYGIADAPAADIVAFFGGNTRNTTSDTSVMQWLKQTKTQYYFSVCTGAFILGKAGMLDGLTVTTFHESIEGLKTAVPKAKVLSNVRFVDNGKIITTAGISAGIDGALHLVEKLRGRAVALNIAKIMEYDKWVPEQGLIMAKQARP